jgi:glycosyltransferase involved in cell wall biosynthesis
VFDAIATRNVQRRATDPPIRVAIDVTALLGARTGIGRLVAGLVETLEARAEVDVARFAVTARARRGAAPNQRLPLPARGARAVWERMNWPPIELWSGQVQVVHGTNYIVPPSPATRLVSVHDLTAIRYPEMCTADVRRMPVLLRRSLRQGAHVHTDSRFVAEEVHAELGVERARIHPIAPGVPISEESLAQARRAPHPFGGRPFALALGTVEPRKDLPMLVRAFADAASGLDDLTMVIAGTDGWGSDALRTAIEALPPAIRTRIIREVDVDDNRRSELLVHASFMAYPSLYEGFGFPPLEAMVAQTPVIATIAGSLPEVLGDGAEFVPIGDRVALSEAMIRLASDGQRRNELIANGRRTVAQYQWSRAAEMFETLYRELANEPS